MYFYTNFPDNNRFRLLKNHTMRFILFLFLFASLPGFISAQSNPGQQYRLLKEVNYVQTKNYYLLTLLEKDAAARKLIEEDPELRKLAASKREQLLESVTNCKNRVSCYTNSLKFSDAEIKNVSGRLRALYQPGNELGTLVKDHLYPSGTYILFNDLPPADLLVKAWEQDAGGINFTIGVYAEGAKPNYPNIDSISFNVSAPFYGAFIHTAADVIAGESEDASLFFAIPLMSALRFLEINERMQAADFEPMEATENKAAVQSIPSINWEQYPYSVILVPGSGPGNATTALSAEAMLRLRLGVIQYKKGMAPFIVVSGGKVHPFKTKYNEAFEMKRYLVETLGIPEKAVIIEPHARHTTTNLRNCARLIYRYGMPFSKPALSSTSRGHSLMISNLLAARCKAELGMVPFTIGQRLTETAVEFYPAIEALQINPKEPMDP